MMVEQSNLKKNCDFCFQPPNRLTRGSQLANGVDRLKYGLYVDFKDDSVFDSLAEAKFEAQQASNPVEKSFGFDENLIYLVHSNGRKGGYNFHLSRADVNIFISTRKNWMHTPNVWVDIGSASCWSPGYNEVVTQISRMVRSVKGVIVKNSVSEVHICADLEQYIDDLDLWKKQCWVTRANDFHEHHTREKLAGVTLDHIGYASFYSAANGFQDTGIELGKGDFMLRVYDKVLEISRNRTKSDLFASVWGFDKFNDSNVTRVEFQLRKRVLREFKVKTLEQLFHSIPELWQYCTNDWARFSSEVIDRKNRHQDRAPTHPFWQKVQDVDWSRPARGIQRERVYNQKDPIQLMQMVLGCGISYSVLEGCRTADPELVYSLLSRSLYKSIQTLHKQRNPKTGETELQRRITQKYLENLPFAVS